MAVARKGKMPKKEKPKAKMKAGWEPTTKKEKAYMKKIRKNIYWRRDSDMQRLYDEGVAKKDEAKKKRGMKIFWNKYRSNRNKEFDQKSLEDY